MKVKDNKFLELSSSPLMNLDHTYRYSGTKLVEAEPLSQHIVDTIMMGLKVIDKVNHLAQCIIVDPSYYVMKAVYHDLEEVITGDIPRPLKYYNDSTRDSLKGVADEVAEKFFKSQFIDWERPYRLWDLAKHGEEGLILKIVDTLVVANKVVKEVSLLNNFYMLRVAHEVSQYLEELSNNLETYVEFSEYPEVRGYLKELIIGAWGVMDEILKDHTDTVKSLNIYGHSMI